MKFVHVVTGGSSGIGFECAKIFKGDTVVISGRNEEKLKTACEQLTEFGCSARYMVCDVSKKDEISELIRYAKSMGPIKTIVNSAGVSGVGYDCKTIFEVDLIGSLHIIEEAKNNMEKGACLVMISSMMGHLVPPNPQCDELLLHPDSDGALEKLAAMMEGKPDQAYNFSKHGVHLMVREAAIEFGKRDMRIVSVSPGIIMTPMALKACEAHPETMEQMKMMTPAGRNGEPEDIAAAVKFVSSEEASFITGTDILVDGGLTKALMKIKR